jgi:hypothetical protein
LLVKVERIVLEEPVSRLDVLELVAFQVVKDPHGHLALLVGLLLLTFSGGLFLLAAVLCARLEFL